jgi:hypothetical protein
MSKLVGARNSYHAIRSTTTTDRNNGVEGQAAIAWYPGCIDTRCRVIVAKSRTDTRKPGTKTLEFALKWRRNLQVKLYVVASLDVRLMVYLFFKTHSICNVKVTMFVTLCL